MLTRADQILKLIVEYFIKTAQPVGSQTLIDEYSLDLSSATIRNEMNALETAGFLEKTHTSSGRVPSSKGYQYYVENLRKGGVDDNIKRNLQLILDQKAQSIEEIIKQSCEILSHMTNLASIVLGPSANQERLVSLQLIPISDNSATAVFVTDKGYVENKTFIINENMTLSDVEKCIALINDRLKGTTISELVPKLNALKPILNDYIIDHDVIYQAMMKAFIRFANDRLSLYGKDELFDQPEFAHDADKLKKVMELLESPEIFRKISDKSQEEINVSIGGDDKELQDVSIITAKVNTGNKNSGSIALIGPKRMDYDKVVSALEYVVGELNKYFDTQKEKEECQNQKKN